MQQTACARKHENRFPSGLNVPSSTIDMKQICFLVDSIFSFGGVQRVTAVIAKELAKRNNVTIVTFDSPADKDTSMYGLCDTSVKYRFFHYPKACLPETILCKIYSLLYRKLLPKTSFTSRIYGLSSFTSRHRKALASELSAGGYDIIVGVHGPLTVRLATIRDRLGDVKVYGWVHNSYQALFSRGSLYAGPELRKHFEYQYLRLDKVVLLCECDRRTYSPIGKAGTVVIHNPLTLIPGQPSDGRGKRFLAVGRFSRRHKGFDLLIEAFSLFAKENSEWTLDIVGEGPEEELYRQMIDRYALNERITLHPFTKNIQEFYSRASVYVLSSRWEGFGLVIVEAMAHGLPVISSDLPSSKEILGDFGMYFHSGDICELAARLEDATAIDHRKMRDEAMRIAGQFDVRNITDKWEELFRKGFV